MLGGHHSSFQSPTAKKAARAGDRETVPTSHPVSAFWGSRLEPSRDPFLSGHFLKFLYILLGVCREASAHPTVPARPSESILCHSREGTQACSGKHFYLKDTWLSLF